MGRKSWWKKKKRLRHKGELLECMEEREGRGENIILWLVELFFFVIYTLNVGELFYPSIVVDPVFRW